MDLSMVIRWGVIGRRSNIISIRSRSKIMRSDFGRSFSRFHRCPQGQVGTTGNIEEAYKELFGIIIRKSYLAAARSFERSIVASWGIVDSYLPVRRRLMVAYPL